MRPRALSRLGLVGSALVAVVLLGAVAAASGSGYNLSYSRGAGSTANSAIDLVGVSSSDGGGATVSVSFTVSGTLNLHDGQYSYFVWFGGSTSGNSTAWATFTNNTTAGQYYSTSGGGSSFGPLPFTATGSTLTFAMNKTALPPASAFTVNVDALYLSNSGSSEGISWLGTDYSGGASCGPGGCLGSTPSSIFAPLVLAAIIAGVVIVVIVVVVVVLVVVMRRKRTPPPVAMPPTVLPPAPPPMAPLPPTPPPPPPG